MLIAIDPGKSGGLATYQSMGSKTAPMIKLYPMPPTNIELNCLLAELDDMDSGKVFAIERLPKFVSGGHVSASSMATLHENYGYILGVADCLTASTPGKSQVYTITPQVWQKFISAGSKKDYGNKWKHHLFEIAKRLYPEVEGLTLKTCDALLILHYAIHEI